MTPRAPYQPEPTGKAPLVIGAIVVALWFLSLVNG